MTKQLTYTRWTGDRLEQQILPPARAYSFPVHIPPARRLTPRLTRRAVVLPVEPRMTMAQWLWELHDWALAGIILGSLLGLALAVLLSLDGWL